MAKASRKKQAPVPATEAEDEDEELRDRRRVAHRLAGCVVVGWLNYVYATVLIEGDDVELLLPDCIDAPDVWNSREVWEDAERKVAVVLAARAVNRIRNPDWSEMQVIFDQPYDYLEFIDETTDLLGLDSGEAEAWVEEVYRKTRKEVSRPRTRHLIEAVAGLLGDPSTLIVDLFQFLTATAEAYDKANVGAAKPGRSAKRSRRKGR